MKIEFLFPVKGDKGESIASVTLKIPTFKQYKTAKIETEDEDSFVEHLITACTGLTQKEVGRLKTPDYNELEYHIRDYCTRPSEFFLQTDNQHIKKDKPQLLVPIGNLKEVELTVPSVKASRVMGKVVDSESEPYAQAEYITKACSDLSENQINQLSIPDWNQLQGRINDFLNQRSAFFQ